MTRRGHPPAAPTRGAQAQGTVVLALLLGVIACVLVVGCGSSEHREASRSPLDDRAGASATPAPSSTPLANAGAASTAPASGPTLSAGSEAETAAGRATAFLAELLGLAQRDVTLLAVEPVTWPDGCIGIYMPGRPCLANPAPGFRIRFQDPLGAKHTMDTDGARMMWAGEQVLRGVLITADAQRSTVTVHGASGDIMLRTTRGTLWLDSRDSLLGRPVALGVDPGAGAASAVVAWVVADPT